MDHSKIFTPPSKLTLPDASISNSDSAFSMPESDASSDESSSPTYSQDVPRQDSSQADSVLEVFDVTYLVIVLGYHIFVQVCHHDDLGYYCFVVRT